jgi:hypothetical protein
VLSNQYKSMMPTKIFPLTFLNDNLPIQEPCQASGDEETLIVIVVCYSKLVEQIEFVITAGV